MAENENGRHQPGGQSTHSSLHSLDESTDHNPSPALSRSTPGGYMIPLFGNLGKCLSGMGMEGTIAISYELLGGKLTRNDPDDTVPPA
jgi:hypothetical protein